ncbi:enoyl-CoA hydratase/carnithine racemase [Metarhizium album ARSEF 1941]|uniref:Enoyl-CoA hydratase/carnithine racemase n=1 Tax=Metarhizium album (strain ARSEF 1941) TaxID=1081103 RepID=A0A0B2WRS1_METAS|nr:enoyl-CoA hydratase/carnithine racemase [Metarhizium album ARSEF 1941]KHN96197.1 enoyl-CoA hydratase/carnithine racemase [Metarhizium album ARSEF 1941]
MTLNDFIHPPPSIPNVILSFPRFHILLVTLNRPKQLNAVPRDLHTRLDALWAWYDAEPVLRCAVLTGRGRAFSAGADLKEWNEGLEKNTPGGADRDPTSAWADSGFGGLSNRRGKKPIVAAVNGLCLGGAMEMILNVDMVISAPDAKFGLPEVTRGVVAVAGALPRLTRIVGRQRASEMALLGGMHSAQKLREWGIVNKVVKAKGEHAVVEEALRWATDVACNSPDSVIVSREGLLGGWDAEDPRASTERVDRGIYQRMYGGENMREGVLSFVERRKAEWKDSRL